MFPEVHIRAHASEKILSKEVLKQYPLRSVTKLYLKAAQILNTYFNLKELLCFLTNTFVPILFIYVSGGL